MVVLYDYCHSPRGPQEFSAVHTNDETGQKLLVDRTTSKTVAAVVIASALSLAVTPALPTAHADPMVDYVLHVALTGPGIAQYEVNNASQGLNPTAIALDVATFLANTTVQNPMWASDYAFYAAGAGYPPFSGGDLYFAVNNGRAIASAYAALTLQNPGWAAQFLQSVAGGAGLDPLAGARALLDFVGPLQAADLLISLTTGLATYTLQNPGWAARYVQDSTGVQPQALLPVVTNLPGLALSVGGALLSLAGYALQNPGYVTNFALSTAAYTVDTLHSLETMASVSVMPPSAALPSTDEQVAIDASGAGTNVYSASDY